MFCRVIHQHLDGLAFAGGFDKSTSDPEGETGVAFEDIWEVVEGVLHHHLQSFQLATII